MEGYVIFLAMVHGALVTKIYDSRFDFKTKILMQICLLILTTILFSLIK